MALTKVKGAGKGERNTFIAGVVEIDEVLFPVTWEGRCVDRVAMVLARYMASSCCKIQGWNVTADGFFFLERTRSSKHTWSFNLLRTIAIFEFDCLGTRGKTEQLVAEADPKDWDLRRCHQFLQRINRVLAMGRVARSIRDEDAVEVVGNFLNGIIVWKGRHACSPADQAAENVFLNPAVDDRNMDISIGGVDVEGGLGADLAN